MIRVYDFNLNFAFSFILGTSKFLNHEDLIICDEQPKKMTVAQAANPMTDAPSEVRSLQT